ncbi:LexA family transcriptional repressor [Geomonas sp. Red32]|uniref:LexA family transcriptional regulator n=1 Tax=Geomonas sp. Red32 TaxID=2912856 RepID=UPI00202CC10B|nr:S24 family peptidase [Geomonas sp. Red32]MCM0081817.1 LexA family transcriptional repressor [Geomonas sp. Red32]
MKPSQFDEAWERVKELTGWTDYKDLAAFARSSSQSISGVKKRGKFPLDWARSIAIEFRSFTDYIMDGQGPKQRLEYMPNLRPDNHVAEQMNMWIWGKEPGTGEAPSAPALSDEYVLVPRYEVSASAGGGTVIESEQIVDHLAFKREWFARMGLSDEATALINVVGDSMEKTLSDQDLILIDLRVNQVVDNAVYVLQMDGRLVVKRIQRRVDGSVIVASDNKVYEPEVVSGELLDSLNVVGRVVWCGRRM